MLVKFSPSINIIRDTKKEFNYVITPNSEKAALTISEQFRKGIHAFTVIGSYGTGKSSFLLALEQSLVDKKKLLPFTSPDYVKFLTFIGVYQSLIEHFAEEFQVKNDFKGNQRILDAIYQEYETVRKKDGLLVLVIDEFGKFLEYAAENNPERELYFIQQLAEFVNDHNRNILLITSLHQNFEAYSGKSLEESQRQEWRKVKGRLKEITFNEPVEQLILLASKALKQRKIAFRGSGESVSLIEKKHHVFSVNQKLIKDVEDSLRPLDFFATYCLTLALQRYGQNERSLFTFLETEKLEDKHFGIPEIYDYLSNEFYSTLTSKDNVDYTQWAIVRHAIERCEASLEQHAEVGVRILKILGLLNLFANKGAQLDENFLSSYFKLSKYNGNVAIAIKELKRFKIVRFNAYNQSFKIFEGTDVNIEDELLRAAKDIPDEIDISKKLADYFNFPYLLAKSASYKKGTPRFFSFEITDQLIKKEARGELDGYIVLVFNDKLSEKSILDFSRTHEEPNLYGYFKKSKLIKSVIIEIEKINLVKTRNHDDLVARKELDNILTGQIRKLNHLVWNEFYSEDVKWIFKGKVKVIETRGDLNRTLSEICEAVYFKTPVFKNELINRQSISGAIHGARKNYFNALVNNYTVEDLGFTKENFPPEKTIYITLLKETGIHKKQEGKAWDFEEPTGRSVFQELWQASEAFLASCESERKPLTNFFDELSQSPFKLKQGLLEFWIPTFLFIKRDDFALFGDQGYIPEINESILYLFTRSTKEFYIKTFDVRGVKLNLYNRYRQFLQLKKENKASNKSFIESIRPFIVLYKQLPEYTKKTNRLNPETLAIRKAIENSQDPEKVFFEDFPKALKTNVKQLSTSKDALESYIANLQGVIRELRTSLDDLIDRIELFIIKEALGNKKLRFPEYKDILQKRYKGLKEHQLLPKQKAFLMRVNSPLDDRKSWINSIVHALVNKPVEQLKDEDEEILKDRLLFAIEEMDNLSELSNQQKNEGEEIIKFDLTTEDGLTKNIIRLPKSKQTEAKKQIAEIKKILVTDKRVNISVLTQLLKDQLKK